MRTILNKLYHNINICQYSKRASSHLKTEQKNRTVVRYILYNFGEIIIDWFETNLAMSYSYYLNYQLLELDNNKEYSVVSSES